MDVAVPTLTESLGMNNVINLSVILFFKLLSGKDPKSSSNDWGLSGPCFPSYWGLLEASKPWGGP